MELRARDAMRAHNVHRLEHIAATPPSDPPPQHKSTRPATTPHEGRNSHLPPLAAVDVYVDDFLLMAQTQPRQRRVLRATLHAIDDVLRPLAPTDPTSRKEPSSTKKMLKGDACWATHKRILGWDLDTVSPPPHFTFPSPRGPTLRAAGNHPTTQKASLP